MIGDEITYIIALTGGLLSFFAPCTFVTLPTFISYLASRATDGSVLNEKGAQYRKKVFLSALVYVLGFLVVFTLLGMTASQLGLSLVQNKGLLTNIGAVVIVLLGIFMLFGDKIPFMHFMYREKKFDVTKKEKINGYFFPFTLGITSALSWTPCVGPILGGILFLASSRVDTVAQGGFMLFLFGLGISIPFLMIALGIGYSEKWVKKLAKHTIWINRVSALLLITIGVALLTGFSDQIFGWIYSIFANLGYTPK